MRNRRAQAAEAGPIPCQTGFQEPRPAPWEGWVPSSQDRNGPGSQGHLPALTGTKQFWAPCASGRVDGDAFADWMDQSRAEAGSALRGHIRHAGDIIPAAEQGCPSQPMSPTEGGVELRATLTGPAEVPGPGDPDGTGTAAVRLTAGEGRLCFDLKAASITLPAAAAHIHIGTAGIAGAVVARLQPPNATGVASGCAIAERMVVRAILANPPATTSTCTRPTTRTAPSAANWPHKRDPRRALGTQCRSSAKPDQPGLPRCRDLMFRVGIGVPDTGRADDSAYRPDWCRASTAV